MYAGEGKEDEMLGGGVREQFEGGGGVGCAGEGTDDKMQGGVAEKNGGGMPERVKKTKCGGGGLLRKKLRGVCRRG